MYLAGRSCRHRADCRNQVDWASPACTTQSELWAALGVRADNGSAIFIRDNRRAFFAALATCGLGFVLIALALAGQRMGSLDGFWLMVLIGLGLYLPYVAMHTTVFERLLALTRDRGNIGFLMYVADAIGYLGYVAVMLGREILKARGELASVESNANSFVEFFFIVGWLTCGVSLVCLRRKLATSPGVARPP
jgi:hypothetical protein